MFSNSIQFGSGVLSSDLIMICLLLLPDLLQSWQIYIDAETQKCKSKWFFPDGMVKWVAVRLLQCDWLWIRDGQIGKTILFKAEEKKKGSLWTVVQVL